MADPAAYRGEIPQIEEASEHTVHRPDAGRFVFKVTKRRPIAGSTGYLRRMYLAGVALGDDVELVGVFGEPGNVGFVIRQKYYPGGHPRNQATITAVLEPLGFEPTSIAGVYDHPEEVMVTDATPNNWLFDPAGNPQGIDIQVGTKAGFDWGTITAATKVDPAQLDLFADLDPNRITVATPETATPPQSAESEPVNGAEVRAAEAEDVLEPVPAPVNRIESVELLPRGARPPAHKLLELQLPVLSAFQVNVSATETETKATTVTAHAARAAGRAEKSGSVLMGVRMGVGRPQPTAAQHEPIG